MRFIEFIKRVDQKLDIENWLCIVLGIVFILRIPSFFEPYSYGDEMIYMSLGEGIRQGLTLYKEIHDNKPPALYVLAAIAGRLFWFKVILAFWNMVTIYLFSKLAKLIFPKNTKFVKVSTIIFALLTTIPLFEGNIVNSELFMIGFTFLGFIVLLSKNLNTKNMFIAGLFFSIGTLFKVPSAFDMLAIFALWLILAKRSFADWFTVIKNSIFVLIGFTVPILITFVWYYAKGALPEYVSAAYLQNVGYLSSFRPDDVQKPFLEKNLPVLIRGLIVFVGFVILFLKRKSLSSGFIFTTLWLLFSLFAVTLSERPYPHYFIQAVPAVSIFLGLLFAQKNMEQILSIIPLALAFFVPFYFHFYHYPTITYYSTFAKFAAGKLSKETYFASFGNQVNRNYRLAEFISSSTKKEDPLFVWEDGSAIYALSRNLPPMKFVAGYHIRDFSTKSDIAKSLENKPPKIIVLFSESEPFPEINDLLQKKYMKTELFSDASVYKIRALEN